MGGELPFHTAVPVLNRIAVVGSFHGSNGLVAETSARARVALIQLSTTALA